MSEGHRDSPASGAEDAIIRPVSYQAAPEVQQSRLPLSPLQMALLVALLMVAGVLWFLFTAKSVRLEFQPPAESLTISGGMKFALGEIWLLREGEYRLQATATGYYALDEALAVSDDRNQTHGFEFRKLPGLVTFETTPPGAVISIGGRPLEGTTPTEPLEVEAGTAEIGFKLDRYQPLLLTAEIEGRQQPQTVEGVLKPNWADVTVTSSPAGASIFIDDEPTNQQTPAVVEVLAGEHEIRLKAPGHKSHRQRILVAAEETRILPEVRLQQADSLLTIRTQPAGAGVTLNGRFQGEAPVEVAVRSGERYRLQAFRAGYAPAETSVRLEAGSERTLTLKLARLTGTLVVKSQPPEAELIINGKTVGKANQTLNLPTEPQRVEIRLAGYAGYSARITPKEGITQEIKVRLLTLEEARLAALKPQVTSPQGQELVLLQPEPFTMGASRRQPGRRGNETLREVNMSRLFYLGRKEVSNAEFRKFQPDHDSGSFEERSLNDDDEPVVNVSWEQAARYCNWLSSQEGLPAFYRESAGNISGFDSTSTGYRLPTEAEWAWSARQIENVEGELRFPWGANLPPPDRHGNYADRSASNLVGRIIFGYNDNHIVAAPSGTFPANAQGIYDLAGNVAEWTNDFYEIPAPDPVTNPLGPKEGEYRVIRGSSWMHGTITELRLSFRDYGIDGRQDVGFRISRFAEAQ